MAAHKKKTVLKKCDRCGEPSKRSHAFENLCLKCQNILPKCGICRTVMAPEYGYMEGFAREVGKYKICDSCSAELKNKGFLHITESQYLMPSGKVRTRNVPAEDKV